MFLLIQLATTTPTTSSKDEQLSSAIFCCQAHYPPADTLSHQVSLRANRPTHPITRALSHTPTAGGKINKRIRCPEQPARDNYPRRPLLRNAFARMRVAGLQAVR